MRFRTTSWASLALAALALTLTLGCSEQPTADSAGSSDAAPADDGRIQVPAEGISPVIEAMLAKADALDGEEDHVVGQCAGCALAMPGSGDHALTVGDYEMHFCSDTCKGHFEGDTEKALMALKLPEEG